jgi:hypothetical protein
MDPSSKQTLVQVVGLIKQGDNRTAVKLLTELLGREPQIEQGWYLLGVALQNPEQKQVAFQQVLKLNPDSQRAKQQLEKLGVEAAPPVPPPTAAEPPAPPPPIEDRLPADEPVSEPSWLKPEEPPSEEPSAPPSWMEPEPPVSEEQPEAPSWAAPEEPLAEEAPEPPPWMAAESPPIDEPVEPAPWEAPDAVSDEETPEPPPWMAAESPPIDEPAEPAPWEAPDSVLDEETPEPPPWAAPESPLADEPTEPAPWAAPDEAAAEEAPEPPPWMAPDSPLAEEPTEPAPWAAPSEPPSDELIQTPSWLSPEQPEDEELLETPSWAAPEPTESASEELWTSSEPFDESGEADLLAWARDIPDTPTEPSEESGLAPEMPSWAQRIEPTSEEPTDDDSREFPAFSFELAEDEPTPIPEPEPEPEIEPEPDEEIEEPKKKKKRKTRKERKAEKLAAKQEEEEQVGEKSLQEELLGDEDTRRRPRFRIRWRPGRGFVIFIILTIICGALGGGAYYYQDELIPVVTEVGPTVIAFVLQQPTPTPDYTSTPTPTTVIPPTMAPTWTPSGGDVGLVADTPTPGPQTTPTITPTPLPLSASIIEEMEKIEEQISAIRELDPPVGIDREMTPRSKFGNYMQGIAENRVDWAAVEQQQIVYRALGFVADDYNAVEVAMNDLSDFVGGFYDAEEEKIVLTGTGFYGLEQFIYSYEFGFALLNQNNDIFDNYCQVLRDTCWAETAMITGDVLLTQEMWLKTYPIQFNPDTYFDFNDPAPLFDDYQTPPYFDLSRNFAVTFGYPFVSQLYDDQGWQAVNSAYRSPPETSEQVLHPEKYEASEPRILLYDPDLLAPLGDGWTLIERETLGEWGTFLLLAATDYPDAVRQEEDAAMAAAGWGGDNYQVYFNAEDNTTVMSAHWNWDTTEDQEEFLVEFVASQARRFENAEIDGPGEGVCWLLDGEYSCVYHNGRDVLWIYATDLAALEVAKATFTQFP